LPISNGASPVASALGIRLGATPRGLHQPNLASPARLSKQDISTLLGLGHFYFALTAGDVDSLFLVSDNLADKLPNEQRRERQQKPEHVQA